MKSDISSFFNSFYGHTWGIWKFLGQGLNPSWRCINTGSFNPLPRVMDWTHAPAATWATAVRFLTYYATAGTALGVSFSLSLFFFFFLTFPSNLVLESSLYASCLVICVVSAWSQRGGCSIGFKSFTGRSAFISSLSVSLTITIKFTLRAFQWVSHPQNQLDKNPVPATVPGAASYMRKEPISKNRRQNESHVLSCIMMSGV